MCDSHTVHVLQDAHYLSSHEAGLVDFEAPFTLNDLVELPVRSQVKYEIEELFILDSN